MSSENCISIIMNTHRTKPGYLKDALALKNLIKEAENRLLAATSKQQTDVLVNKLEALADKIEHDHNLDSLMLFVNEDVSECIKLPLPVTDRVVLDTTFATRDLVRAMHTESNYYVLVLSQDKVRFIEALNDKVVQEFAGVFPMENTQFPTRNNTEPVVSSRQRQLIAEFFNQVDKEVNKIRQQNPLPVLICTVEENYSEYLKIADEKHSIIDTFLSRNRITEKDHAIVADAYEVIKTYNRNNTIARKEALQKAISDGRFLNDISDIWKALNKGRVQTLFIEKGLYQPAIIKPDSLEVIVVSEFQRTDSNVIDDIYDEMIEINMRYGGDVVFMPKGELEAYNGFVAITRY
ncbi:hypothetical protein ACFSQP_11315 [Bizionia sediminis]|uniref:Uncharacterized protein n=1 Tax=Bizionia sediminis TaxID=1737064 RepID=A0ABW5KUZ3_9FLAO